jgi:hypothetical protein
MYFSLKLDLTFRGGISDEISDLQLSYNIQRRNLTARVSLHGTAPFLIELIIEVNGKPRGKENRIFSSEQVN